MSIQRTFGYMLYRLRNQACIRSHDIEIYSDTSFSKRSIHLERGARILFDFSHSSTHLGDRLFFAPIIFELIRLGYQIYTSDNDGITNPLFQRLDAKVALDSVSSGENVDLVVIPSASLLALNQRYTKNNLLIFQFTRAKNHDIIDDLGYAFSKITGLQISDLSLTNFPQMVQSVNNKTDENYFLFSNYIDSGWFRKFMINGSALEKKAYELKKDGYRIIHIGSKDDLAGDSMDYKFVDIDLRGTLSIVELVDLISSKRIVGAVTYDNFIMHLVGIFDKKAFVLFRGRFLKHNVDLHINFVNSVFFRSYNNISYLKNN